MNQKQKVDFKYFLGKFPKIDLPITLSEDSHFDFSRVNEPLPLEMIQQYLINPKDQVELDDEYGEYIACFQLKKTEKFHAIVYWKATLLNYQYVMLTFSPKGTLIDRSVIAGTKVENNTLIRSVATIDEDWIIYVMAGVSATTEDAYDAASSKSFHLELLATGKIISAE